MAGIYFHIPFCKTRCIYCDFFSSTSMKEKEWYVDALCKEISLQSDYLKGESTETIYFGGGTPSQLTAEDFKKIFTQIKVSYPSALSKPDEMEITLEANPDDLTIEYLDSLKDLPFNRISLGIQSFQDSELDFLNRRHTAQSAIEAVRLCQVAGFNNISIDLMYGLPGQTMVIWKENLHHALALDIQHISAYHLIYEEGTPLYNQSEKKQINPIDEKLSVEMFETLIDTLTESGFEHYEISNFARKGYRSRHNSSYWDGTHYLGIGASAHSYNGVSRQWNVSSIPEYIRSISLGDNSQISETEKIDEKTAYNDFILTRMRTMEGMNFTELSSVFGKEKADYCIQHAKKYIDTQMLEIKEDHLMLTRKGIFVSDSIMSDLMIL